jgi:leucyl/phenylalanyl-tRNA---protein transferase
MSSSRQKSQVSREFPYLDEHASFTFPPLEDATKEGIVAAGGNLSPGMLLSAYRQGIFPWYSEEDPILWWCPDPRFVLFPNELHVSRSLARVIGRGRFTVTFDRAFGQVIDACRSVPRPGQPGTWITDEIVEGYSRLHELGYAHSVEVRLGNELAGGLYGVSLGDVFYGESMFSRVDNASKVALVALTEFLIGRGCTLIDCQAHTDHLERMGAREIPRAEFLTLLERGLQTPTRRGPWREIERIANQ